MPNTNTRNFQSIQQAAQAIRQGGIVAYPTEGVFGLGCDPLNTKAVNRLLQLKQRAASKGLILLAATKFQLDAFLQPLAPQLDTSLDECWPGPVTWILPCNDALPDIISGGRQSIAARVTSHPVAAALCRAAGRAIVSTSANIAGEPPCLSADCILDTFGSQLDAVLDGPLGGLDGPTPIFDGTSGRQLR